MVENTPSEWLSMHNSQFDNESSLNWTMKMAINYEWGGVAELQSISMTYMKRRSCGEMETKAAHERRAVHFI